MSTAILNKPRQKNRPPKPQNPLNNIEKTNKDRVLIAPDQEVAGDILMELKTNNKFLKETNQSALEDFKKLGPKGENTPLELFESFKKLNETRKSSGDLLLRVAYNQNNIKEENYQMVAEFVENFSRCLVLEEYYLDYFISSFPSKKESFTELREKVKRLQKSSYNLYDRALHEGIRSFLKRTFGKERRGKKSEKERKIQGIVDKAFKENFRPDDAIVSAIEMFQRKYKTYRENPHLEKVKQKAREVENRGSKGADIRRKARSSASKSIGSPKFGAGVVREAVSPLDVFLDAILQKVNGTPYQNVLDTVTTPQKAVDSSDEPLPDLSPLDPMDPQRAIPKDLSSDEVPQLYDPPKGPVKSDASVYTGKTTSPRGDFKKTDIEAAELVRKMKDRDNLKDVTVDDIKDLEARQGTDFSTEFGFEKGEEGGFAVDTQNFIQELKDIVDQFKSMFSNFEELSHVRLKSGAFPQKAGETYLKDPIKEKTENPYLKTASKSNLHHVLSYLGFLEKLVQSKLPGMTSKNFHKRIKEFLKTSVKSTEEKKQVLILFYQISKMLVGFHRSLESVIKAMTKKGKSVPSEARVKAKNGLNRYVTSTKRIAGMLSKLNKENQ